MQTVLMKRMWRSQTLSVRFDRRRRPRPFSLRGSWFDPDSLICEKWRHQPDRSGHKTDPREGQWLPIPILITGIYIDYIFAIKRNGSLCPLEYLSITLWVRCHRMRKVRHRDGTLIYVGNTSKPPKVMGIFHGKVKMEREGRNENLSNSTGYLLSDIIQLINRTNHIDTGMPRPKEDWLVMWEYTLNFPGVCIRWRNYCVRNEVTVTCRVSWSLIVESIKRY